MTRLVESFEDKLISNFTETWGTKNIFNIKLFEWNANLNYNLN